jgi:voltage-gated potassium channel
MKIDNILVRTANLAIATSIVGSLIIVFVQYIFPLGFDERLILDGFDLALVIVLARDYVSRLNKEKGRKLFFLLKNWYELPALIPLIIFLPIDPSSNLHSISFLVLFRLFRLYQILTLLNGKGGEFVILTGITAISIIFGGFAVVIAESNNQESNIKNVSDGVWWAITTITTVGYGDYYPVTSLGKVIGSFVMFIGLAFLTSFAGIIGSSLIAHRLKQRDDERGGRSVLNNTKEFVINQVHHIEHLDENDLETLINIIRALNKENANQSEKG